MIKLPQVLCQRLEVCNSKQIKAMKVFGEAIEDDLRAKKMQTAKIRRNKAKKEQLQFDFGLRLYNSFDK